jgi:hypothetical protein
MYFPSHACSQLDHPLILKPLLHHRPLSHHHHVRITLSQCIPFHLGHSARQQAHPDAGREAEASGAFSRSSLKGLHVYYNTDLVSLHS